MGAELDAAEALVDVEVPARLAELAVADDVDPGLPLGGHDLADAVAQAGPVGGPVVLLAGVDPAQERDQRVGPDEAPDMGRADGHGAILAARRLQALIAPALNPVT
jgi:hypothetical protein